jgi:tubulin-specific chaperone B
VNDTRPPEAQPNYSDVSGVAKYEMPQAEYAARTDSVLAWKKASRLGRFDPAAADAAAARVRTWASDIEERGMCF